MYRGVSACRHWEGQTILVDGLFDIGGRHIICSLLLTFGSCSVVMQRYNIGVPPFVHNVRFDAIKALKMKTTDFDIVNLWFRTSKSLFSASLTYGFPKMSFLFILYTIHLNTVTS